MKPEAKAKKNVVDQLKSMGAYYFYPITGGYGASGVPDIVACYQGKFIGIECKADRTKKPTALQLKTMKEIEEQGGKCFVVYDDETIQEVVDYITEELVEYYRIKK